MPAIPIVVGALATSAGYTALAAGGLTLLGTVAAGATLLGGVAMIAGTLKGGAEGAKWTGDGGMLAAIGSLGMNALGPSGMTEAGAAESTAGATDITATGIDPGAPAANLAEGGAGAVPNISGTNPGGALSDAQIVGSSGNTTAFSGNPLNTTVTPPISNSPSALTSPAAASAPTINASGTGVTAGNDAAARTAATTIQPPSSSLTSNNNLMTLAGNAMQGYNQGQMTQAQMDAYKALQTQRIQADAAARAATQYNPLLTASNK